MTHFLVNGDTVTTATNAESTNMKLMIEIMYCGSLMVLVLNVFNYAVLVVVVGLWGVGGCDDVGWW